MPNMLKVEVSRQGIKVLGALDFERVAELDTLISRMPKEYAHTIDFSDFAVLASSGLAMLAHNLIRYRVMYGTAITGLDANLTRIVKAFDENNVFEF